MIERVIISGIEFALILRSGPSEAGIHFYTPPDFSQQLAAMNHPAGHVIRPHLHNFIPRAIQYTQEALFIRRGRLRVDFYQPNGVMVGSRELGPGDVILLIAGGHGFEVLEEVDVVEVKQGPYVGESDKTLLSPPDKF